MIIKRKLNKYLASMVLASMAFGVDARKPLASGDIVGRDLDSPIIGKLGHVGMGTGDDIGLPTQLIIETLNETPVIQFNSLKNFVSRSPYWGSRSGFGDYSSGTRAALHEGLMQYYWCPKYTITTDFIVGDGYITKTGEKVPTRCGKFRCDTFVGWIWYKAGYQNLLKIRPFYPINVWKAFPIFNQDNIKDKPTEITLYNGKPFHELTTEELNKMPFDMFSQIADIPKEEQTPTFIVTEWKFLADKKLNSTLRGAFVDKLIMSNEPNIIDRFFEILKNEDNEEVRESIISGTMFYYQNHWNEVKNSSDYETLKSFYHNLLREKLSPTLSPTVLRGYIDFHSADEIKDDKFFMSQYEGYLNNMEERMALGLYYELASKSEDFQQTNIKSMIKFLKLKNRSDLDGMFFGLIGGSLKEYKNKATINLIKGYQEDSKSKYAGSKLKVDDPYFVMAKQELDNLSKKLSLI